MSEFRRRIMMAIGKIDSGGGGGDFPPIDNLTARIFFRSGAYCLTDIVPAAGDWFKLKVDVTSSSNDERNFIGYRANNNSDTDAVSIAADGYGIGYNGLKAKMYGTQYASSQGLSSNTQYIIQAKPSGVSVNPALGSFNTTTYIFGSAGILAIGGLHLSNGNVVNTRGGIDIYAIEIYSSRNKIKHRLIPQSDLTFKDEVTNTSYSCSGSVVYADD